MSTPDDFAATVVATMPDAVVVIDGVGAVRWVNAAAERLMERRAEDIAGINGLDLVHPDDHQLAAVSLTSVQGKTVGSPIEVRLRTADGWRLMEIIGAPLPNGDVLLTMRDLTDRRRWEVASDETARFRSLVHHGAVLTMLVRPDGTVASASAAVTRDLGHDPEDVYDRPLTDLVPTDEEGLVHVALASASTADRQRVTFEVSLLTAKGDAVPYELTIVSLLDDPIVGGLVVSGHDISRLRTAQEALAELAHFDSLTGLANRRAFEAELEREWTLTTRDGIDSFLVVADLDGFKQLNDTHGHAAGDEALRQFAHALRVTVRETDVVARLGGDEFAVLLIRCGGEAAAHGFRVDLNAVLTERLWAHGFELGVSIGHTSLRRATSPHDAFEAADQAMYAAKRSRRVAER